MNNINYSLPTTEWGVQLYPLDQTTELQFVDDEILNNNFAVLYQKINQAKKDLSFLDFMKVVGVINSQSDITSSLVDSLLPGEALAVNSNVTVPALNDNYVAGDYILRMPDQSFQHVYGFTPLGFLPRFCATPNNTLTLYYYANSSLTDIYTKIEVDYSSSTPVITGYKSGGTENLGWNDVNGYFTDSTGANIVNLVKEYTYKYNIPTEDINRKYASVQLTGSSYSATINTSTSSGVIKLYTFKPVNNGDQNVSYIIEEIFNGLSISYSNSTLTVSLVDNLKTFATNNQNIQWWVEVK